MAPTSETGKSGEKAGEKADRDDADSLAGDNALNETVGSADSPKAEFSKTEQQVTAQQVTAQQVTAQQVTAQQVTAQQVAVQQGTVQQGTVQKITAPKSVAAGTSRGSSSLPPPLPRSPQRSLLVPAVFAFLISAPAVYALHTASQSLSPWILLVYLFLVWALGILLAFLTRRGPRLHSKAGWSSRV